MSDVLVFWLSLCVGVLVYAVLTLPTWLFASMNRSTLWRLRDDIAGARRRHVLPDTPEVDDLIKRIEAVILVLPSVTALQFWWLRKRLGELEGDGAFKTLTEGDRPAHDFFLVAQLELGRIVLRHHLIGSWSGLFFVAPRHLSALRLVFSPRPPFEHWSTVPPRVEMTAEHRERESDLVQRVERLASQVHRKSGDLISAA